MIVKVKAFANLREVFGGEMNIILKEGAVLKDLLSSTYLPPRAAEAILDNAGNINSSILILKNGRNIWFSENLLTKLEAGDEVSIFPPLCGG
ncbi:molybdopterin synthase sulfur carrier subunit [Candidatus Atribacteria bacterium HGW-Atribacteria-1]|nr:MAG: molybdopterin synthase sulfur carrier subunit [Candidatus Atribacteria bacterium HGW-Atribacteria-1]